MRKYLFISLIVLFSGLSAHADLDQLPGLVNSYLQEFHRWQDGIEAEEKAKQEKAEAKALAAQKAEFEQNETRRKDGFQRLILTLEKEKQELSKPKVTEAPKATAPAAEEALVQPPSAQPAQPAATAATAPATPAAPAAAAATNAAQAKVPAELAQAAKEIPKQSEPAVAQEDIQQQALDGYNARFLSVIRSAPMKAMQRSACRLISERWNGGTLGQRIMQPIRNAADEAAIAMAQAEYGLSSVYSRAWTVSGVGARPGVRLETYNDLIASITAHYMEHPEDRDALAFLLRCISERVGVDADMHSIDRLDAFTESMDFMGKWGLTAAFAFSLRKEIGKGAVKSWKFLSAGGIARALDSIGGGLRSVDTTARLITPNYLEAMGDFARTGSDELSGLKLYQTPSSLDQMFQMFRGMPAAAGQATQALARRYNTWIEDAKTLWYTRLNKVQSEGVAHAIGQGLKAMAPSAKEVLKQGLIAGSFGAVHYVGGLNARSEPPKFPPVQILKLVQPLIIAELEGKTEELSRSAEKVWKLASDAKGGKIDRAKVRKNIAAIEAALPKILKGDPAAGKARAEVPTMDKKGTELGLIELRRELSHFEREDQTNEIRRRIEGEPDYSLQVDFQGVRQGFEDYLVKTRWAALRNVKFWDQNPYYITTEYRMNAFLSRQKALISRIEKEETRLRDIVERLKADNMARVAAIPEVLNVLRIREELELISVRVLMMREAIALQKADDKLKNLIPAEAVEKLKALGINDPNDLLELGVGR